MSNIIEKIDLWNIKQYDIINLQLNIEDYTFISKLLVQSLWGDQGDIFLSTWMKSLGQLILNMEKKFMTFSYKKKKNNVIGCYAETKFSNTRRKNISQK